MPRFLDPIASPAPERAPSARRRDALAAASVAVACLACAPVGDHLPNLSYPAEPPTWCTAGADRGLGLHAASACVSLTEGRADGSGARLHLAETTAGELGPAALAVLNIFTVGALTFVGVPAGSRTKQIRVRYESGDCVANGQAAIRQPVGIYYPAITARNYAKAVARAIASLQAPVGVDCARARSQTAETTGASDA